MCTCNVSAPILCSVRKSLKGFRTLLIVPRRKVTPLVILVLLLIMIMLLITLERLPRHPAVERTITAVLRLSGCRMVGDEKAPLIMS